MALTLSCALNTSLDSPEQARVAEQLGYDTVWHYDSPALYADVWVQLCRAAERTERVRLGPAVLVPTLRHPMTSAAAIGTLVAAAGADRVAVTVGSGFTGALCLGKRPAKWAFVADYIRALRALLRGDEAQWDSATIRMLHYPGFAPERPIDVPILVAAQGPKGQAVAEELGDGVFTTGTPVPGFDRSALLLFGTVLDDGEDPGSERCVAAAGPGASVQLHFAAEFGLLDKVPGGREWASAYDEVPADQRHLAMHDGHLAGVNRWDRPFVTGELLAAGGLAMSPAQLRDRLAEIEAAGATEVAYQPAGPDVPRELEAFAEAARG
ncbi:MAG TPA: LLM class flavin-dependent oxidoreductase [Pseudonocardia sp.]